MATENEDLGRHPLSFQGKASIPIAISMAWV
jgi:hypothetical protein